MSFLRDARRFCVDLECDFCYNNKVNKCKIFDVSVKGMLLKLNIPIQIKDRLTLFFDKRDSSLSKIEVETVHKKDNFVGVKFLDYTTKFQKAIGLFVNQIAPL